MVAVRLGGKARMREGEGEKESTVMATVKGRMETNTNIIAPKKLVRHYRSREEDINWAMRGLVGTVLNGESISIIQNRVEDAGFKDIYIIPLGADKVFVQSLSNVSVSEIVREAKQFFDLIFASLVRWDKKVLPFQRGAWLCVYGIPLHAWNEKNFKLCVLDCGRYLRADSVSLNKERFDYARVLISTPSIDVVNVTEQILVNGVLLDIKIIEEWGFCMGYDVCLYGEDDKSVHSCPNGDEVHAGFEMDENVDTFVDKVVKEMVNVEEEDVNVDEQDKSVNFETTETIDGHATKVHIVSVTDSSKEVSQVVASSTNEADISAMNGLIGVQPFNVSHQPFSEGSAPPSRARRSKIVSNAKIDHQEVVSRKRRVKTSLCSQDDTGSSRSGRWSAEWLHNVQKDDIGLISSKKKRLKKMVADTAGNGGGNKCQVVRKKAGGVFRHPVFTLKKVARLPSKDREEVMKVMKKSTIMKVLKQKVRNRQRQR